MVVGMSLAVRVIPCLDVDAGRVVNRVLGVEHQAEAYPDFMLGLIRAGGLTPYTKRRLASGVFDRLRGGADARAAGAGP